MAIRFKHQVGAGIIGAYASGVAKSQQRRQKYDLDLYQQERQHQMGMEERLAPAKYRAALGGMGGGLGGGGRAGAIGGEWADPMAGAIGGELADPMAGAIARGANSQLLTPQAKVQMNAQRRANARASRMGRPAPYPEAEPQFTPGWKIAAKKEDEAARLKREQDLKDAELAQAGREKIANITDKRAKRKAVESGLAKIPEHITGEDRQHLAGLLSGIKRMLRDPEHDISDPDTWDALMDAVEKYEDAIAGLPPEDKTDPNLVLDPATNQFRPPNPGEEPQYGRDDNGKLYELPSYIRKREQQEAEQEQQKKAKDAWAAQQKGILAEAKTRLAAYNKDKETGDPDKTLSDFMGEVEGDYITAGIPLVRNPNAPSPTDGISLSGGGGESVTGDAGVVTPPGAPAAGAQEVTVNPDGSVDIPPAAQETPAATAPQQPGQGPQQPAATPGAPHTGQAPPGAVREIPGSNPPAWEMEDGSTVFQMHDGTRVKVVPVPERTQPGGGRAEPTPAAPAAAKGTRQSRRERYLDIQSRKPATTVGLPATPPKGKASENMIAKGHEYVQLLDSKGQPRPGKYTWRPKQPEQIRSGPVASATGKFFGGTEIPRPNTKAEFDKIPSGATFYDPAGVLRRKP